MRSPVQRLNAFFLLSHSTPNLKMLPLHCIAQILHA